MKAGILICPSNWACRLIQKCHGAQMPRIDPGRSIWICPANPACAATDNNLFHYCLNKNVNGTGTGNQIRLVSIPHPSVTVWLFDNGGIAAVAQWNNVHSNLHSHGAQFVFLDGHAAWFKNTEYWNPKTKQGPHQQSEAGLDSLKPLSWRAINAEESDAVRHVGGEGEIGRRSRPGCVASGVHVVRFDETSML